MGDISRQGEPSKVRDIAVWDPLVRTVHWSVALGVVLNGYVTDPEHEWHRWIGYAIGVMVVLRLGWGVIGPNPARFAAFPPSPGRALRHLRALRGATAPVHLSHNPLGALMVYNLWATLAALTVTGYMMGTFRFFGIAWVETMHDLAFDWLILSVMLHLGGVVFDSNRTGVPLLRAMITGRKRIPANTGIEE